MKIKPLRFLPVITNKIEINNIIETIQKWVYSKEIEKLVYLFNSEIPSNLSLEKRVLWLLNFSEKNFNFRKSKERWEIKNEKINFKTTIAVINSIKKLGLKGITKPKLNDYDYIIALGGLKCSCFQRVAYCKRIVKQISQKNKTFIALGSFRKTFDIEHKQLKRYAKNAKTEFDLMNFATIKTFNLNNNFTEISSKQINLNKSWLIRTYNKKNFPIIVVSAPSTEPEKRRANTSDTFKFLLSKNLIKKKSKVLFVTNQIYVNYQQLQAIKLLSLNFGIYVETIGAPNKFKLPTNIKLKAVYYLQEIRSTIIAINELLNVLNNN